jgi:predicted enzyme related to lactoylglutathione lyase
LNAGFRLEGSLWPESLAIFCESLSRSSALIRRIFDRQKIQHQQKGKNMSKSEKKQDASIVWFEIPADDPERAKSFYSNLFGWKINPFPGSGDYSHIDTGGADDTPDGALKRRQRPEEPIVNYVSVNSVDKFADKIAKLGGKVCMAKTAVPQMGYFAVCQDTEDNSFGLWESDANAK